MAFSRSHWWCRWECRTHCWEMCSMWELCHLLLYTVQWKHQMSKISKNLIIKLVIWVKKDNAFQGPSKILLFKGSGDLTLLKWTQISRYNIHLWFSAGNSFIRQVTPVLTSAAPCCHAMCMAITCCIYKLFAQSTSYSCIHVWLFCKGFFKVKNCEKNTLRSSIRQDLLESCFFTERREREISRNVVYDVIFDTITYSSVLQKHIFFRAEYKHQTFTEFQLSSLFRSIG